MIPAGWTPVDEKPPHNVSVRIILNGVVTSSPAHYDHQLNEWFWSNCYGVGGKITAWKFWEPSKDQLSLFNETTL